MSSQPSGMGASDFFGGGASIWEFPEISKKLEHGSRTIYAGVPSFLALGLEDGFPGSQGCGAAPEISGPKALY